MQSLLIRARQRYSVQSSECVHSGSSVVNDTSYATIYLSLQQLSLIHRQYVAMKSAQETPEVRDLAIVKEDIYEGLCR